MTDKDYKLIAGVLLDLSGTSVMTKAFRLKIAGQFAAALARKDPDFDRERFLADCMWDG